MIYSLTGKIIKKTLNAVVICCGGVGYYAQCPASVAGALPGVGKEATIYTVMSVTENDVSLYGFASEEQQACFELLTSVSGVGAKVGLAILSVMEPDRVALAIEKLFYQHNQTTVIGVAEARGVILLAAAQAGLPIYEYTPMQVKQAVTGYGKAVKKQVQEMTRVLLHLPAIPKPDDTADALAMAITFCHTNGSQLNRFVRRVPGPI